MQPRRLLNLPEQATHRRLEAAVTRHGGGVFPKVRVSDVLPTTNSGISSDHFAFALRAHFDFVVTDSSYYPQFAVEYDGPSHADARQATLDQKKDFLCDYFGLPLLRIDGEFLDRAFGQTDMLSWLMDTWFCAIEHERQQANGIVPFDDTFDPGFVLIHPGAAKEYPLWISRAVQGWLRARFMAKQVLDFGPSHITVSDELGTFRSFAWILTSSEGGAVSRAILQPQRFPYGLAAAAEELAVYGLRSRVEAILAGRTVPVPRIAIEDELARVTRQYEVRRGMFLGDISPGLRPQFQ